MLLERAAPRRGLYVLETVYELQRIAIEDRELLLHCDGEVGAALVRVASETDLLVGAETLLVAHRRPTLRQRRERAGVGRRSSSSNARRPRGARPHRGARARRPGGPAA